MPVRIARQLMPSVRSPPAMMTTIPIPIDQNEWEIFT